MAFNMKGSPMRRNFGVGSSALKQTRETSWWRGEEGWIPDELQGIVRPEVKDQAWHDERGHQDLLNLRKKQKETERAIIKEYGSLQNEPVPENLVETHKRASDGSLYDARFANPHNPGSR